MELYFQNLAHFLRYYFQNIYNIEDKSEFKNYTFKYLQTNIHLKLPDILIDYLEKNKKRLIKNTIKNSYIYCYHCDNDINVTDTNELACIDKIHSIYEIIKEIHNDMLDNSVIYIAICNKCYDSNSSFSTISTSNSSLDSQEDE